MRRRALLASLGFAATASASGCLVSLEDRLDTTVQLGWFGVHNFTADPHVFDLRVTHGGVRVHESSHEVRGREERFVHGAVAECDWGSEPGDYRVVARVDGGDWESASLTAFDARWTDDVDCAIADVQYRDHGLAVVLGRGCDRDYNGMCQFAAQRAAAATDEDGSQRIHVAPTE